MQNLIFFVLIPFLFSSCSSEKENPKTKQTIPVLAVEPTVKDVPVYVETIGKLQPSVYMEIRPQVSGTVDAVHIKEGQWVLQGTSLISIDPKPYQIKVQEAEAQYKMDLAALNGTEKKLKRFESLARKDLVAQTEWDELETQKTKAEASVEADKARLLSAKLDLERCTILSPLAGRVGKLDIQPGHLVSSTQTTPIATISQTDPLLVEFSVTEKEAPFVSKVKDEIEIQALCTEEFCTKGKITFLDNQFDAKSGLLFIRGKVPNSQYAMRPGQSVQVRIPISVVPQAKLIPQKAVKYNQQGPYVYVILPDSTVAIRQILLGKEQEKEVIVTEGIDPAEKIITDGHLRLHPGIKVEIAQ